MIRFISCIKRRDDVSIEEFRHFWNSLAFDELQERVSRVLGANRFQHSLTLAVEANDLIMDERGLAEPFDGLIEYWWEQARDVLRLAESPEGRSALQDMREYQAQFVDFAHSHAFFTET
jgi:hypothetical protein